MIKLIILFAIAFLPFQSFAKSTQDQHKKTKKHAAVQSKKHLAAKKTAVHKAKPKLKVASKKWSKKKTAAIPKHTKSLRKPASVKSKAHKKT